MITPSLADGVLVLLLVSTQYTNLTELYLCFGRSNSLGWQAAVKSSQPHDSRRWLAHTCMPSQAEQCCVWWAAAGRPAHQLECALEDHSWSDPLQQDQPGRPTSQVCGLFMPQIICSEFCSMEYIHLFYIIYRSDILFPLSTLTLFIRSSMNFMHWLKHLWSACCWPHIRVLCICSFACANICVGQSSMSQSLQLKVGQNLL